ncbi:hypothetical protein [Cerasicoccus frondis]|uniref:hypothetical protein n=1 Tax=Cerasicoccus frondis TaxID=490090 RepID=UPI0028528CF7|nr:hypothetical protein [Cerasicoccus frondis]
MIKLLKECILVAAYLRTNKSEQSLEKIRSMRSHIDFMEKEGIDPHLYTPKYCADKRAELNEVEASVRANLAEELKVRKDFAALMRLLPAAIIHDLKKVKISLHLLEYIFPRKYREGQWNFARDDLRMDQLESFAEAKSKGDRALLKLIFGWRWACIIVNALYCCYVTGPILKIFSSFFKGV